MIKIWVGEGGVFAIRGVLPIKGLTVSYGSAAGELKAEVKKMGLGDISLHSRGLVR